MADPIHGTIIGADFEGRVPVPGTGADPGRIVIWVAAPPDTRVGRRAVVLTDPEPGRVRPKPDGARETRTQVLLRQASPTRWRPARPTAAGARARMWRDAQRAWSAFPARWLAGLEPSKAYPADRTRVIAEDAAFVAAFGASTDLAPFLEAHDRSIKELARATRTPPLFVPLDVAAEQRRLDAMGERTAALRTCRTAAARV